MLKISLKTLLSDLMNKHEKESNNFIDKGDNAIEIVKVMPIVHYRASLIVKQQDNGDGFIITDEGKFAKHINDGFSPKVRKAIGVVKPMHQVTSNSLVLLNAIQRYFDNVCANLIGAITMESYFRFLKSYSAQSMAVQTDKEAASDSSDDSGSVGSDESSEESSSSDSSQNGDSSANVPSKSAIIGDMNDASSENQNVDDTVSPVLRKRYANGTLSRADLFNLKSDGKTLDMSKPKHALDSKFVKAYKKTVHDFHYDSQFFVDGDGSLYLKRADGSRLALILFKNNKSKSKVTDNFYRFLVKQDSWNNIANGNFGLTVYRLKA